MRKTRGFTLLEVLVVAMIISIIVIIVVASLDVSRKKSRDANRATQIQEFLKAAELFYADNGAYPDDLVGDNAYNQIGLVAQFQVPHGGYFSRVPEDPIFDAANGYMYCSSSDGDSMALLVHAESGGGDYCYVDRGPDPVGSYCGVLPPNSGGCSNRF